MRAAKRAAMRATIKDVADLCNVSITTVSLVLNNKGHISEETREQVREAVKELDYRRRQSSGTIALLGPTVPDSMLSCLYRAVAEYGYSLHHLPWKPDIEELPPFPNNIRITGFLIYGGLWKQTLLKEIAGAYPTVLLGGSFPGTEVDEVWVDNIDGINRATNYLIDHGHVSIGLVNGPRQSHTTDLKQLGFERALRRAAPEVAGHMVISEGFREEHGLEATRRLLSEHPDITAIISGERLLPHSVYRVLQEMGYAIPGDISVIAFRDDQSFVSFSPPVTVIDIPNMEIAREAVQHLLRRLDNHKLPGRNVLVKPRLIMRGSVAVPSATSAPPTSFAPPT